MIVAGVSFQGCTVQQTSPAAPVVPKELHMQSPSDPNNPQQDKPPIPEMLGATSRPFELGKVTSTVSFEIQSPTGPALLRSDGQPKRVLLRAEKVTSTIPAPPFDVYLNLPPGEEAEKHPDLYAFTLSTFGLVESSTSGDQHPGNGLNFLEDVTELFVRLNAMKDWDRKTIRASFVPSSWVGDIKVQVGRLSLMME
jgi:hypothetical protein